VLPLLPRVAGLRIYAYVFAGGPDLVGDRAFVAAEGASGGPRLVVVGHTNPQFYGVSLTEELQFSMAFKYHRRISAYEAEQKLKKALDRRFPFWRIGYLKRAECKGREPRWRCRVRFAAGDTSFSGKAKVKVRAVRNRPQFRVRYRITRTNHYCIAVYDRPRSACTKTYRGRVRI
jgi:hypothetical protein